ncbi:hypothetical protein Tco_1142283 [Tanacetum coccineum]
MDLIHPIGQKNTLAEYMILFGVDNRPLMLDKDLYDSWKSRMELYMQNRENGRMILESVEHDKSKVKYDLKATNIILQGLPSDIYSLVNHHRVAKDLWEKVQLSNASLPPEWSQQRVVKCCNCQGEGHMARQYPKPKRKRDATWFKKKVLLVEAQGNSKVLNEEELEFLADPGIVEGLVTQSIITHNVAYQVDDLDAYDSDCDEIFRAKAVLMANFSSYESNVLSEYLIESQNAAVQDTNSSAQQDALILSVFEKLSNQVTNCNKVNNDNLISNESSSAELERYKEWVKLLEERKIVDLSTREKLIIDDILREKNAYFADFEKEINNLKQTLSEQSKEKELLTKTFNVFEINPRKKKLRILIQNFLWKRKLRNWTTLKIQLGQCYKDEVIAKETNVISIANSEETLMLEEESRSKMLLKQNFGKRFVPQRELSDEQALNLLLTNLFLRLSKLRLFGNFLRNSKSKKVCNEHVKHLVKGAKALCSICDKCLFDANNAMCLIDHVNSMNVRAKSISKENKKRKEWKPTGKVFNSIGYKRKPTRRTFTLDGNVCPLTRLTATKKVPLRLPIPLEVVAPKQVVTRVYTRRPKVPKSVQNSKPKVVKSMTANRMEPDTSRGSDTSVAPSSSSIIYCRLSKLFCSIWTRCSKHMTRDRSQLTNFVYKFLGAIKFGNDQVGKIIRYGDYHIGNVTISRVYYVEVLGHNLFSVSQFCDLNLEVAFRKHTCFVRNLEGVDLLSGSRGTNLYSLSIG